MTKHHNKLVRDKIPKIIEKAGKKAHTHILSEEEYIAELDKKLGEEFAEYQADKALKNLRICLRSCTLSQKQEAGRYPSLKLSAEKKLKSVVRLIREYFLKG